MYTHSKACFSQSFEQTLIQKPICVHYHNHLHHFYLCHNVQLLLNSVKKELK